MGVNAQFTEKEFETLANASFIQQAPTGNHGALVIFSPGQTLEKHLGFDFSIYLDPTSSTYKLLFGTFPGAPRDIGYPRSNPKGMPSINGVVNTFIQYKRPEFFTKDHRQSVWHNQSFLRFDVRSKYTRKGRTCIDHSQLSTLYDLCVRNPRVKIRYACPSVWTREDLYNQFSSHALINESSFVDPRQLLLDPSDPDGGWHEFWTFEPDNPSTGRPNPSGPFRESQSGQYFLTQVKEEASQVHETRFTEEIGRIQRTTSESLYGSAYFESWSENLDATKREAVEKAKKSVANDFLSWPRGRSWLMKSNPDREGVSRTPDSTELKTIETAVEVAATAKELGLVWMSATT